MYYEVKTMTWFLIGICVLLIVAIIIQKIKINDKEKELEKISDEINKDTNENIAFNQYYRKNLMTKNEWSFYKSLKPIADKLNYSILAKVRVADLIGIKNGVSNSEWHIAFNKISRKHIDFILCKPENLYPMLLIELDDNSHNEEKQKQRDEFIEKLYKNTGYKLLRVTSASGIEDKIKKALEE